MKKFLQQILTSTIGSFAGILLFFAVAGGGFLILLVGLLMSSSTPKVENQSALVFNLASQVSDYQTSTNILGLNNENDNALNLQEIVSAINQASEDDRINVLYLDGSKGNTLAGYGTLTEIREALENFRDSGKKIIAYNVSLGEKDYYLTSIADEVNLNPMGIMEINGLASSQLFFADAFAKYGIGVQIIRAGKYKSAIEPFIRNNYSAESRLQTTELLNDIWDSWSLNISEPRSLSVENINQLADEQGILGSQEAQDLKFVDHVKYQDKVIDELKKMTNSEDEDTFRQIDIKTYLNANTPKQENDKNQIAILYLEGPIVDGEGQIGQVGSTRYVKEIRQIRENDKIKGVIARINSPGGSAVASELILRELKLTAEKKPVVVSMGDVAASGGYWIATAGEKIFAHDATVTGSIGVFGVLFNLENVALENGVNNEVVKTNQLADLGNGFKSKTPEELAIYQDNVERIYNLFLDKVSQSRNIPVNQVAQIAQGRVWSGKSALEKGLVDEIGGLDQAISYLNEKLGLNQKYKLSNYPTKRTLETELLNRLNNSKLNLTINDREKLAQLIWESNTNLQLQQILDNPYQVYSILPYNFEIK